MRWRHNTPKLTASSSQPINLLLIWLVWSAVKHKYKTMYSYTPCLDKRLDERLRNSHLYINAVTRRYQDSKNTLWGSLETIKCFDTVILRLIRVLSWAWNMVHKVYFYLKSRCKMNGALVNSNVNVSSRCRADNCQYTDGVQQDVQEFISHLSHAMSIESA